MTVTIPEPSAAIRSILIVDDHPLYCAALVSSLGEIFAAEKIETANCLSQALICEERPDLVLLDLKLPDVQGLSGFVRLRDQMPDVPIVVISAEISDEQLTDVQAMGGAGYISKNASQADIETALGKVVLGEASFPARITDYQRTPEEQQNAQDIIRKIAELTPQQTRVLRLICNGKLNKQIAYEMNLAEATVKAHVTALLRRLGVQNRTQAALLVQSIHESGVHLRLSEADG